MQNKESFEIDFLKYLVADIRYNCLHNEEGAFNMLHYKFNSSSENVV